MAAKLCSLKAAAAGVLAALTAVSTACIPAEAASAGTIRDTGIIQSDYAISDADYQSYLAMYAALPESLRYELESRCWKIVFTQKTVEQSVDDMYDAFEAEHPDYSFPRQTVSEKANAYTWSGGNTVYIMKKYTDYASKDRICSTMYHELGHVADNIVENIMIEDGILSSRLIYSYYSCTDTAFRDIYLEEAFSDSESYAKTSPIEYFACSFSQYLTGKDPQMAERQPETYGYVTGELNIIANDYAEALAAGE